MKRYIVLFLLIVIALPIFGAEYTSTEGDLKVSANILQLGKTVVKAKNQIKLFAQMDEKSKINVKCNQLQITASDEGSTSIKNLKNCIFKDNVIVKYESVDEEQGKVTVISYSESAYYEGNTKMLVLTDNVELEYITEKGTRMTAKGKKAVINLNEELTNEDIIFAIEGDDGKDAELSNNSDLL